MKEANWVSGTRGTLWMVAAAAGTVVIVDMCKDGYARKP